MVLNLFKRQLIVLEISHASKFGKETDEVTEIKSLVFSQN